MRTTSPTSIIPFFLLSLFLTQSYPFSLAFSLSLFLPVSLFLCLSPSHTQTHTRTYTHTHTHTHTLTHSLSLSLSLYRPLLLDFRVVHEAPSNFSLPLSNSLVCPAISLSQLDEASGRKEMEGNPKRTAYLPQIFDQRLGR